MDITFRQLLEDFTTPQELAAYLDSMLPEDSFVPESAVVQTVGVSQPLPNVGNMPATYMNRQGMAVLELLK